MLTLPRLIASLVLLPVLALAQPSAPDAAPTDAELRRFISAYRATDAPLIALRHAAQVEAERGSSRQAAYGRCVAAAVTPEVMVATILPVLRQDFRSGARLNALSTFFESSTGQKLLDQLAAMLPRVRFEGSKLQAPELKVQDFSFTAAETIELQELERRPEYRELEAFVARLKNRGLTQVNPNSPLAEIQTNCRKQAQ